MLLEFAELVESLFPAIDPAVARSCINSLKSWYTNPEQLYSRSPLPTLSQGDVIEPVTFHFEESDGDFIEYTGPALVISNSCDIDQRDDRLMLVPCFDEAEYSGHPSWSSIKANTFYSLLYLPRVVGHLSLVADLSRVYSRPLQAVLDEIDSKRVRRVAALSRLGLYFFIAKLTVHFLRPERAELPQEKRAAPRKPAPLQRVTTTAFGVARWVSARVAVLLRSS